MYFINLKFVVTGQCFLILTEYISSLSLYSMSIDKDYTESKNIKYEDVTLEYCPVTYLQNI